MKGDDLCLSYGCVFDYKPRLPTRLNYVDKSNYTVHCSYRQHANCALERPDHRLSRCREAGCHEPV